TNGIAVDAAEEMEESRARGNHFEERRELLRQPRLVAERKRLGRRLEEEVERIQDRHLGHEVDVDRQLAGRVGKDVSRQVIAVRILLPVDEVLARRDVERICEDGGPTVRRRPQSDEMW